jgi:large conductance mechanosensitive channel
LFRQFKKFISSGNVLDWAIGIVVGTAFGKIVNSFVNDIIMPPIGLLLGKVDFRDLFIDLSGQHYKSLPLAHQAGIATINYGIFINAILDFLLVSVVVFVVVSQVNRFSREPTKECPFCLSSIPEQAIRCPHCTSNLETWH